MISRRHRIGRKVRKKKIEEERVVGEAESDVDSDSDCSEWSSSSTSGSSSCSSTSSSGSGSSNRAVESHANVIDEELEAACMSITIHANDEEVSHLVTCSAEGSSDKECRGKQ